MVPNSTAAFNRVGAPGTVFEVSTTVSPTILSVVATVLDLEDPRRRVFGRGTMSHGGRVGKGLEKGVEHKDEAGEERRERDSGNEELGIPQG